MSSEAPQPEGYHCANCDKYHPFSNYVFAHWDDTIHHKCDCGTGHAIREGKAQPRRKRPS